MIEFPNGGRLVEVASEFPKFRDEDLEELFADFETTSFDDKLDSLNPWHHCWVLGIAVAVPSQFGAWYVPVRHRRSDGSYSVNDHITNLPLDAVIAWWSDLMERAKRWINHHVKYDALVSCCDFGVEPDGELFCTVVHSKIIDSDRQYKGGYGLDALSKAWLGHDISEHENEIKRWIGKSKDYGRCPREPMGEYACQDVMTNKTLYKYIQQRRPAECDQVASMETELTRCLLKIERVGLCVDPIELKTRNIETIATMLALEDELHGIIGRTINPCSGDDVYDVLCNQYGMPVLHWTEENGEDEFGKPVPAGNPSFDKEGMRKYLAHPYAPKRVVEIIAEYRKHSTHKSLFLDTYDDLYVEHADGSKRLHGQFNQSLRTGRMGQRKPNLQQLDKRAKELIHPPPGCAIFSADQSQIEFRVIAHYINDPYVIKAYNDDPDTDFHDWVKNMAGMKRDPAKTMNFMMGYGGGRKKAVRVLSCDLEVIGGVVGRVDQMIAEGLISESQRVATFERLCVEKADSVYDMYHNTLPTLKSTSRRATATCKEQGFVRNLHGRRRHLPTEAAHRAFNSACQGEAADIQKERTVALSRALEGTPIELCANVHDDTVGYGPISIVESRDFQIRLAWLLEHPVWPIGRELKVPLRVSLGTSRLHWREAGTTRAKGGPSGPIHYTPEELEMLRSTPEEELFSQWRTGAINDIVDAASETAAD